LTLSAPRRARSCADDGEHGGCYLFDLEPERTECRGRCRLLHKPPTLFTARTFPAAVPLLLLLDSLTQPPVAPPGVAMSLSDYLRARGGDGPIFARINGAERAVYRDYKRRGYFVVVGAATYDVVSTPGVVPMLTIDPVPLAPAEVAAIKAAYEARSWKRWRWVGDNKAVAVETP